MAPLPLELDRAGRTPLAVQIYGAIREAIVTGRLVPGAKLPSWRDLAIQLGISRGTVRVAYERLINEELAIGKGAAGTRVAQSPPRSAIARLSSEAPPLPGLFSYGFGVAPLAFQMGVPSQEAFPSKLWSRILSNAARRAAVAPVAYPDPRGEPDLRNEIAAYLGITRGIRCNPSQVLVTAGLSNALCLAIRGLQLDGLTAWMEEPGFPITRSALGLTGMTVAAVSVDRGGAGCRGRRPERSRSGAGSRDTRPTGAARHDDVHASAACTDRMGATERRLDHRRRLPERVASWKDARLRLSLLWILAGGCCISAASAKPSARRFALASWSCRRITLVSSGNSLLA